jgi:tRNA(Ile2) C34 agmatinyltransferase TiaS
MMRTMTTMRTLAIGVMVLLSTTAVLVAHHGLAAFDRTTKVTLEGTVTDFHFVAPHAVVEFEVKDDTGQIHTWQAEMTNPRNLKGWTATSLEPGDIVTVTGYRAKSGALFVWVTELSSSNGMKLRGA